MRSQQGMVSTHVVQDNTIIDDWASRLGNPLIPTEEDGFPSRPSVLPDELRGALLLPSESGSLSTLRSSDASLIKAVMNDDGSLSCSTLGASGDPASNRYPARIGVVQMENGVPNGRASPPKCPSPVVGLSGAGSTPAGMSHESNSSASQDWSLSDTDLRELLNDSNSKEGGAQGAQSAKDAQSVQCNNLGSLTAVLEDFELPGIGTCDMKSRFGQFPSETNGDYSSVSSMVSCPEIGKDGSRASSVVSAVGPLAMQTSPMAGETNYNAQLPWNLLRGTSNSTVQSEELGQSQSKTSLYSSQVSYAGVSPNQNSVERSQETSGSSGEKSSSVQSASIVGLPHMSIGNETLYEDALEGSLNSGAAEL